MVEYSELISEQGGLVELMRDQHDRDVERAEDLRELTPGPRPRAGVECGQRLIEQQHLRAWGQRPSQRHALALATRQRCRLGVGALGQP